MKYVSRERCSHVKFSGSEFNTQNLCKSRRKELFPNLSSAIHVCSVVYIMHMHTHILTQTDKKDTAPIKKNIVFSIGLTGKVR